VSPLIYSIQIDSCYLEAFILVSRLLVTISKNLVISTDKSVAIMHWWKLVTCNNWRFVMTGKGTYRYSRSCLLSWFAPWLSNLSLMGDSVFSSRVQPKDQHSKFSPANFRKFRMSSLSLVNIVGPGLSVHYALTFTTSQQRDGTASYRPNRIHYRYSTCPKSSLEALMMYCNYTS
jgi:hypothetical protein